MYYIKTQYVNNNKNNTNSSIILVYQWSKIGWWSGC